MKKHYLSVAIVLTLAGTISLSSCIGSFGLTNKVLSWNNQVGNKFINELVFFAFWVLPVYEVTSLADLLILNSIEFWSGRNPLAQGTSVIPSEHGDYLVACDGKGYTITHKDSGREMRLDFNDDTDTWSYVKDGEKYPFMTIVDDTHVKMITPEGDFRTMELNEENVMAYKQECTKASPQLMYAMR